MKLPLLSMTTYVEGLRDISASHTNQALYATTHSKHETQISTENRFIQQPHCEHVEGPEKCLEGCCSRLGYFFYKMSSVSGEEQ